MLFMKRTLPLIITFVTGILMILAFFSGPGLPTLKMLDKEMPDWIRITMTFAMILGGVSLLQINLLKVQRKVDGWGFNLVLVIGFVVMSTLGFLSGFEGFSSRLVPGAQLYLLDDQTADWSLVTIKQINMEKDTIEDEKTKVKTPVEFVSNVTVLLESRKDDQGHTIVYDKDGKVVPIQAIFPQNPEGSPLTPPETSEKAISEFVTAHKAEGFTVNKEVVVQSSKLKGWLLSSMARLQNVLFDGVFKAAQATMFSLLAFFVASASFRAFRVKSREAALLMGAAFIVMLGNVPIGNLLTQFLSHFWLGWIDFPAMKEWIMMYPSSAAQSAILIGASLGYISASLKIILGVERSYLGGGES